LHLVGWFIWKVWWCTDLQTLNDNSVSIKWVHLLDQTLMCVVSYVNIQNKGRELCISAPARNRSWKQARKNTSWLFVSTRTKFFLKAVKQRLWAIPYADKKNISFQETHLHESICHSLLELLLINVPLQPHLFCRGRQGSRRASNSWRDLSYRWPWHCRLPHLTRKHVTSTPPWHYIVAQQTSQPDWYRYTHRPLSQISGLISVSWQCVG